MKKVHNLIILDESGSMESIRKQALSGLNETMQTIISAQKKFPEMEQRTTVLLFDSENIRYVFLNEKTDGLRHLTKDDYRPNACTPLYDAIGKGISDIQGLLDKDETAVVTIITDGYENSSRKYSLEMITKLIDMMKEKKWTFAFIGTDNLDVKTMARDFHIDDHISFAQDAEGTELMFHKMSNASMRFNECLSAGHAPEPGSYFDDTDEEQKD